MASTVKLLAALLVKLTPEHSLGIPETTQDSEMFKNPVCLARNILQKYDPEPSHATHVAGLAIQIFEQLAGHQALSPRLKEVLHVAALLHDVGHAFSPDGKNHHIHSEQFILSQSWPKWDAGTTLICARVARLHRKRISSMDTELHTLVRVGPQLDESGSVASLAAILRVADALDRSHTQTIRAVRLKQISSVWHLNTEPSKIGREELYGLSKKSDLWEKRFGILLWPGKKQDQPKRLHSTTFEREFKHES